MCNEVELYNYSICVAMSNVLCYTIIMPNVSYFLVMHNTTSFVMKWNRPFIEKYYFILQCLEYFTTYISNEYGMFSKVYLIHHIYYILFADVHITISKINLRV